MDDETATYMRYQVLVEDFIEELAEGLRQATDDSLVDQFVTLSKIGLSSSDRLTVMKTQAQVLFYVGELLNSERLVWNQTWNEVE